MAADADKPKLGNRGGIVSQDSLQDSLEFNNEDHTQMSLDKALQDTFFHELNFFPIPVQSNVYGLSSISSENSTKLLVATLKGKIYGLSFNQQSMQSTLKAISFSYIPTLAAEIISIDVFVTESYGPLVGVTLVIMKKDPDSSREVFFNIYGLHTKPTTSPDWEKIAEDWQTQTLSYTPFLLTHTKLSSSDGGSDCTETVFLLSGDDCRVHVYRHVNEEIGFREEKSAGCFFPEFEELHSSVTCIDIAFDSSTRLTALGCQDGYIRCSQIDLATNCLLWTCDNTSLDGPVTSVRLFRNHTHKQSKGGVETVHLLVTLAIEAACVFIDVLQSELKGCPLLLPSSELYDSVVCSEVADIDWNGQNELLLGTYGKRLLVYNLFQKDSGEYDARLKYKREFAHPIHRIMYSDITGDGLCELLVLSTAGLHVLQHDLHKVFQVLDSRIAVQ